MFGAKIFVYSCKVMMTKVFQLTTSYFCCLVPACATKPTAVITQDESGSVPGLIVALFRSLQIK